MKKRHKYNLSAPRITTFNPGEFVPIACTEVIPGDTFRGSTSVMLRCSPLLAPVMAKATVRVHHFWVPNRITWPVSEDGGWEGFLTQPADGTQDVPSFQIPFAEKDSDLARLYEHLGCPAHTITADGQLEVSQLPGRAYWSVWNEWIRDPDFQTELDITDFTDYDVGIQKVCWGKDRFTLARSSPQFGDAITIPIGTSAPVVIDNATLNPANPLSDLGQLQTFGDATTSPDFPAHLSAGTVLDQGGLRDVYLRGTADLTGVTGFQIEQLREAAALQRYAERLQKGHRYPEVLMGLGMPIKDSMIQRPELLGSGHVVIRFSEVMQTSNGTTGPDDVVGAMYGHGIAPGRTRTFTKFFMEHGYILSCISVVPQAVYANSVPRHFFKGFSGGLPQTVERLIDDYYQPELEMLGDKPIFKKEVYPNGQAGDNTVFGYGPNYDEYRRGYAQVAGEFMPGRALDYWTWARSFSSQPTLNGPFLECTPSNRIFADQTGTDLLWCFCFNDLRARRMVTPKTIGRLM